MQTAYPMGYFDRRAAFKLRAAQYDRLGRAGHSIGLPFPASGNLRQGVASLARNDSIGKAGLLFIMNDRLGRAGLLIAQNDNL